mgnify:CR=1 FL=1
MEKEIDLASNHGIDVFLYDWYWYNEGVMSMQESLEEGFLKAKNRDKMKFAIMWANHDATHLWDIRNSDSVRSTIWQGTVTREQFEIIGKRWIEQYFKRENYYRIDGKPVISIYDINNLINGLGGIAETIDALQWLNKEAQKEGLDGVHLQFIRWRGKIRNHSVFHYNNLGIF